MPSPAIDRLRDIKTLPQLLAYLRDELDWPITSNNTEDITFDYEPSELGLDKQTAVKIKEIKQLRPLSGNQPWGIFFVNFEKKRLPVMVMRRILRSLVFKKRNVAGKSERQAWHASDLLFISAYGEEDDRTITFAHFVEKPATNLAELRVLGWDDDDTPLHMEYVIQTLNDKLAWDTGFAADPNAWREKWSDAFVLQYRHVVRTSAELALVLAQLAKRLRRRIRTILRSEDGFGQMRKLQKAFRDGLIHDLDDERFADMFAQTVTYGLFSVACRRTFPGHGTAFVKEDAMHYFTSPFLKEMLGIFLGIQSRKGSIDFDELGVSDVTDLLTSSNIHLDAVLRDFNNRTRTEDPVIYFYEHFLDAYDHVDRKRRGIYYTPRPVVSYIVRSVHELLQSEFKLEYGLADTATWGDMLKRNPEIKLPPLSDLPGETETVSRNEFFVQVLDPATGTATFLVEVIDVIYNELRSRWKAGGLSAMPELALTSFPRQPADFSDYWNQYVGSALLPRLYGYELMMAPYAIADMRIGLKLWETGYRFQTGERAQIYLTNALEPYVKQLPLIGFEPLAHEAATVNEVKRHKRFTVVIGNPPYAGNSSNRGAWIENLINDYRKVDGQPLGEVKVWLKDDYVKFIRFAEQVLETTHLGILGFITNNSFFDGLTFRGMRHHLLSRASCGYFMNLHGNGNLKERAPDGSLDENVFDILQGVGITLLLKDSVPENNPCAFCTDLYGTRGGKYQRLASSRFAKRDYGPTNPRSPNYFVVRQNEQGRDEYEKFVRVPDLFEVGGLGFQSHRDRFVVAHSEDEITKRMKVFFNLTLSDKEVKERLGIDDYRRFVVREYRRQNKFDKTSIRRIQYRPFDYRYIYYARHIIQEWQIRFHGHMLKPNLGLNVMRQTKAPEWRHVMVSSTPTPAVFVEIKDGSSQFPLYRYNESEDTLFATKGCRAPNLNRHVASEWLSRLGAAASWLEASAKGLTLVTPEDIFNYTYAVFHSPTYRSRYAEFLKIDFPRLPLTGNPDLVRALAKLGGDLVALHLLESPKLDKRRTEFIGSNRTVEKVSYSKNTVWIDKPQTSGFRSAPDEVWNFHIGGYQVCEKWLKDRKGRTLTKDDIAHYHKIVIALAETIRLMSEIDKVIEKHGGWPGAFQTGEQAQKI
jgi:hypothetical protein